MPVTTLKPQIDDTLSARMALYERRTCSQCHSKRSYGNPMAWCRECEKDFCYEHIRSGFSPKDGKEAPLQDVCLPCFQSKNYVS